MSSGDRELGMGRNISRRDFVQGAAAMGALACALPDGGSLLPERDSPRRPYAPAASGLRGSQPGSFEVAHRVAFQGRSDWPSAEVSDDREYDLVVVGAGVSGLAAAHFFRARNPDARVLILDNHDDFGGHVRRNEFSYGGRTVIGYGGSESMESPGQYSPVAKALLRELAVDTSRFETAYDREFFRRHGLSTGVYFDRAHYGVDRLVPFELVWPSDIWPGESDFLSPGIDREEAIRRMPIPESAKRELRHLYQLSASGSEDRSKLPGLLELSEMSYADFLSRHLGVRNPEVWKLLESAIAGSMAQGLEACLAIDGLLYGGLPGLPKAFLAELNRSWYGEEVEPYIYHFPDGNASIARLLVRKLIPQVAPGETMEDVVTAHFDYGRLDDSASPVRLRLESTVIRVEHEGSPASADRVSIEYVRAGRAEHIRAKTCVLACYNRMIPHLCAELPASQRTALGTLVKLPLVYTNVLLRNWQPWRKAGLAEAYCPGAYHQTVRLDYPVSLGEYRFSEGPDEPIVARLEHAPIPSGGQLEPREQYRLGRRHLLATDFESIERSLRTEMAGMLGEFGFDPFRDIEAITVNRWPHGYAYSAEGDPSFEGDVYPYEHARRSLGRIAIANSDSGGRAYIDAAIDEAHRAVGELPV